MTNERTATPALGDRIRTILAIDPSAPAIEFEGAWHTWGELSAILEALDGAMIDASMLIHTPVGVLLRNTPAMVGAMLGVLATDRCLVTINPHQGDAKVASDIVDLRTPALIAHTADWQRPALLAAAREARCLGLELTGDPSEPVRVVAGLTRADGSSYRAKQAGVAVEMLTSGTTGTPKRIQLQRAAFERTIVAAGDHYRKRDAEDRQPRLSKGVAIVNAPFVHMSGLFRTLLNVCEGRRIALLERFAVEPWLELVRRHQPRAVALVPTALRMVLDANVDPKDLKSIEVVTSGSAKLDVDLQVAFEQRFGIPVLPSYGATEFAGGVAGWTLPLYREWGERKRGSVGRAQPGRALRIVAMETAAPQPDGEVGLIEVRASAKAQWQRTTDLGRLDADGFLWVLGRTDDAILRGGFKVMPADVQRVLTSHPAVRDACVVGLPDSRLGNVPVAAVELHDGAAVDEVSLKDFARDRLSGYQVPVAIRIVGALPRTPSLKVSRPDVRALFEGHAT